ncbi:hypothetical protein AWZ03_004921 [Drosophila navojoa]|uniref:Uncharacterized protein n=1 Tax=Drosophila navojoa TaxID=7232 RepID=A0A484BK54_DRONA|nr:hypothetical protein AWZ03_004921 [Drosophila navojoa]
MPDAPFYENSRQRRSRGWHPSNASALSYACECSTPQSRFSHSASWLAGWLPACLRGALCERDAAHRRQQQQQQQQHQNESSSAQQSLAQAAIFGFWWLAANQKKWSREQSRWSCSYVAAHLPQLHLVYDVDVALRQMTNAAGQAVSQAGRQSVSHQQVAAGGNSWRRCIAWHAIDKELWPVAIGANGLSHHMAPSCGSDVNLPCG